VIRTLRAGGESVIVQIGDGDLRIAVPQWMLDQSHCRMLILMEHARVDLDALRQLREIVDLQLDRLRGNNMGSHPIEPTGEHHGQGPTTDSPTNA
jgi:hypothetical protein